MKSRVIVPVLAALALTLGPPAVRAATLPSPADEGPVLAHVNGDPVTLKQVLAMFSDRHSGHAKFLGGDVELRKFLKIVIDDRLLVQEGYSLGIDEDAEVKASVDRFTRDKITKALVRMEIDEKAKPTPERLREVWNDRLDVVFQVRQFVLPSSQEAAEVRAAILGGTNMDKLARECSIGDSAKRGGVLMVNWGLLDAAAEAALWRLDSGDVSEVIPTGTGYEVYFVDARVEVPRPEFDAVKSDLESVLLRRGLEERKRVFAEELRTRYSVETKIDDLPIAGLQQLMASEPDRVIARWNGGQLTLRETINQDEAALLASVPEEFGRRQFTGRVNVTINGALVDRAAREMKIDELPQIAREVDEYRDYIIEALLFRDHIFKKIELTDGEIEKYFQENAEMFATPPQLNVAQILVATEKEAADVVSKLASGADFGALAAKRSRDIVSAQSGGDLGWITYDKIPPAFAGLEKASPGTVLEPARTDAGWHVVKLLATKPKTPARLADVRDKVRSAALDAKKRELRTYWVDKLRAAGKVEIDDKAIAEFVKQNEFDEKAAPPQHMPK